MNDLDSSRHTIICMYIIIMSIFSDTHTMVFKHPVRWMLTSCGANCITMQPRSQQRGCGKLKSEHWIWGFRVFQFNPPLFDFFVWVRKVRVYVYIFLYNIFLLVSVIPAVAKHKLNRQGCSMSGGAYWHPLTPNIYIHVSRHLLFWKFLGWTTMPAPS